MSSKEELLIRTAELYYQQNLSQNAIAEILGTSRPTVSRLLDEARENKIVEIIIHNPIRKNPELSNKLRTEFNLRDAIVISGSYSYEEALEKCSLAASQFLHSIMENNISIGISWGKPMNHLASILEPFEYYNVNVIQMVGCLGTGNPNIDGLEIAIKMSEKFHGTYSNIYAPAFVDNEVVYKYLVSQPQIHATLKKTSNIDIFITGIGSLRDETSTLQQSGYLNEDERQALISKGCVGHLLARMFDIDGNEVHLDNKYVISAPLHTLKKPKWSVCICAHPRKTEAVFAAIRSGYINTLITDESLAQSLLNLKKTFK